MVSLDGLRYAKYARSMPSPLNDAVAAEVRAEVARQALTQQQLADRLGEGQWWVSRRLTGDVAWEIADLMRVAEALGVQVTQFIPAAVAS